MRKAELTLFLVTGEHMKLFVVISLAALWLVVPHPMMQ